VASCDRRLGLDIRDSPWLTRGWTLQESILSRRRLCFGSSGVFLWCRRELFHESILLETGPSRRPSEPSFDPIFGGTFSFEPILSKNWNLRTYTRLVNAYTKRNLSVDSDAHRALVGMLNKVSQVTGENFAYGLLEENLVSCMLWEGTFA
jgi:hypothetical protein